MKLTRENYELMFFEMLEGSLDEKTVAELQEQIDQDPFYQKEWKLMQQTILSTSDDPVVFEHKEKLYKPVARIMPVFIWKYAAAAVLVISAWYGARWAIQDSGDAGPTLAGDKGKEVLEHNPANGDEPLPEALPEAPAESKEQDQFVPDRSATVAVSGIKPSPSGQDKKKVKRGVPSPDRLAIISEVALAEPPVTEAVPAIAMAEVTAMPDLPQEDPLAANNGEEERRSLRELVNNGLSQLADPYRNPKIRISRLEDQQDKAVNITFTSAAYNTSTVLRLKRQE